MNMNNYDHIQIRRHSQSVIVYNNMLVSFKGKGAGHTDQKCRSHVKGCQVVWTYT